jgi:hypothetical protein
MAMMGTVTDKIVVFISGVTARRVDVWDVALPPTLWTVRMLRRRLPADSKAVSERGRSAFSQAELAIRRARHVGPVLAVPSRRLRPAMGT